jgi:cobyric acid synthase
VDLERGNSKLHEVLEKGEFHEALLSWLWNQNPRSSNSQEASISSLEKFERKFQFINILYPFWM